MSERITIIREGEKMPTSEKSFERINKILADLEKPGAQPTLEQLAEVEAKINEHYRFLDLGAQTGLEARVARALRREK